MHNRLSLGQWLMPSVYIVASDSEMLTRYHAGLSLFSFPISFQYEGFAVVTSTTSSFTIHANMIFGSSISSVSKCNITIGREGYNTYISMKTLAIGR